MPTQRRKYRRHLPHQVPENYPLFITWNLKGAVPRNTKDELLRRRKELEDKPAHAGETRSARALRHEKILFAVTDRLLEQNDSGPQFLADARCAEIVERAILLGAEKAYSLYAYVVMSNHVHVLLKPHVALQSITQAIKGSSARQINLVRGTTGRPVWQDESYDHWPRDEDEFRRIIQYIERNPVTCGLCSTPESWVWSSASRRANGAWPIGQPLDVGRILQSLKRTTLSRRSQAKA